MNQQTSKRGSKYLFLPLCLFPCSQYTNLKIDSTKYYLKDLTLKYAYKILPHCTGLCIIKVHSVNCRICIRHFCCGKSKIKLDIVSLKFSNTTKISFCSHKNILRSDTITKYTRVPKTYLRSFLRLWKNNCVSRKPYKRRSDLVLNGQMRVPK